MAHVAFDGEGAIADDFLKIGGIAHRHPLALYPKAGNHRPGDRHFASRFLQLVRQRGEREFVRQVDPARIAAVGVKVARIVDLVMRSAARNDRLGLLHRIGRKVGDRDVVVPDAVHEAGVRTVFQKTAHQIGEQRFVRADRGIDAARAVQLGRGDDFFVKRFAHAVQALVFPVADFEVRSGQVIDRGQRLGIMRRELRENRVAIVQQLFRAGKIGHVGVHLAREDGEILQPFDLRALDLAVPVRPLDQPDHDAAISAAGEVDDPVDDERATLAIGLHDEAQPVPSGQILVHRQRFDDVEREFEAVCLFGVDVEPDVIRLGELCQFQHPGRQFGHHPVRLCADIAGEQRGQLDRNARPLVDTAPVRCLADGVDRAFVVGIIPVRVRRGRRCFAQHVVAVGKALGLVDAGALQRFPDRLSGDELFAHQLHRDVDALPDDRLARTRDHTGQRGGKRLVVNARHQLARNNKAPSRRVHEQRAALPQVRLPIAIGDLVADQRVSRFGIGDAQQRFGKAHQRNAFVAGQRVFLDQSFDPAALAFLAKGLHQIFGQVAHRRAQIVGQLCRRDKRYDTVRFGAAIGRRDHLAQAGCRPNRGSERSERMVKVHGRAFSSV